MAAVHLGRLMGGRGFSRLVAIKMLHEGRTSTHGVRGLEAEARIGGRVQHPNVVPVFDVVADEREVGVVMEYVHGLSASQLLGEQAGAGVDPALFAAVWSSILHDAVLGLHAAHDATDATGRPLGLVHRDVSPQNVMVGVDGIARVMDFGIARGARSESVTESGAVRGKGWYMSPEQRRGLPLTRQADVFAAGIVLAEGLTVATPVAREGDVDAWQARLVAAVTHPRLHEIVVLATHPDVRRRYATAAEMADALAAAMTMPARTETGRVVSRLGAEVLDVRAELARRVEALDPEADDEAAASGPVGAVVTEAGTSRARSRSPRRAARALPLLLAAAMLLVLAGAGVLRPRVARAVAASALPPPAAPSLPPHGPDVPASLVASLASPPVLSEPAPSAPPPAPSSPGPALATHAAPTTPRATATRARSLASRAPGRPDSAAPRAGCDPPFSVDASGKKHYVAACFR